MDATQSTFLLLWYCIIHIHITSGVAVTNILATRHGERDNLTTLVDSAKPDNNTETIHLNNQDIEPSDGTISDYHYTLPSVWAGFCKIVGFTMYDSEYSGRINMTSIRCNVTSTYSGIWRLDDMRKSVAMINDTNIHLDVNILCSDNANISLPEPVQLDSLSRLSVINCVITDFLSEYNKTNTNKYTDSLRTKVFIDNIVAISLRNFISLMENIEHISKDYLCGHEETIETIIIRNITYIFVFDIMMFDPSTLGSKFSRGATRIEHVCIYKHLAYLEETRINSMSIYHGTLLTEHSVFDELQYINMSYNNIKVLKDEQIQWSATFPKLKIFDLSHNQISMLYRFEMPIHPSENQTTVINMQHNNISMVTVKDLDRYRHLPMMYIDLRNNFINCSCSENMKELIRYIQDNKHLDIVVNDVSKNYSYIGDLKCNAPEEITGKALLELTTRSVCPVINESTKEYFVVPLVIMSVVLLVLGITIIVLVRYRREVLILMFTRFHVIMPCQSRYRGDDKRYDAFVSYSSKEDDWVENFFEQLEQPTDNDDQQFKFCLHHRDFVPGQTIFDNVVKSVEQSRHTIILLSRHYLGSEFCLYEFQEAFRQSVMEQRRHLVIVMMEELREAELPLQLRRCIKTFTYIRKHDYLFRDRLVYALSVKENTKHRVKKPKIAADDKNVPNDLNAKDKTVCSIKPPPRENKRHLSQMTNRDKLTPLSINVRYNTHAIERDSINANMDKSNIAVDNTTKITTACDNTGFVSDTRHDCLTNINCNIPTDVASELRKDSYDRSLSTFSHDTGYFSSTPSCTDTPSPAELKNGIIPMNIGGVTCDY